jgi:hypothetical protein
MEHGAGKPIGRADQGREECRKRLFVACFCSRDQLGLTDRQGPHTVVMNTRPSNCSVARILPPDPQVAAYTSQALIHQSPGGRDHASEPCVGDSRLGGPTRTTLALGGAAGYVSRGLTLPTAEGPTHSSVRVVGWSGGTRWATPLGGAAHKRVEGPAPGEPRVRRLENLAVSGRVLSGSVRAW